ncbi:MAG: hypothetical protein AUH08_07035 [Verrucomicrobia bacterium 13_2_20CM_54_12]|nr:MAG: hypothetical protein AUH08_07035 [Verrucomicrobia bacterium 13_2_20CM_54_12]OLD74189.1 MAG: hypothetical protein AUF68_01240 [Verrucomicrobia bacterium 13_1_20CM_54_28]OLD89164.1 MAG: hypothetical protein AUG81_05060 [Verrucomicrobia bacterium 13_1_20CM_4_54_11]OLE12097.1 MAG: hypothetical protein AUG52_04670 [Verrucomicrobia bacterium 13_1_20CM_3_54_17]PYK15579.1 MAG: hypothetical protein DME64_06335 [Verrucomicrobiota bacterium]
MKAAAAQNSGARKMIIILAVMITVCLVSLIVAGATSLISLADRIHPVAGTVVFWAVCLTAGFFALYCAIAYARLPAALVPPEEDSGPKHDVYLQALRVRLAANPRTRDLPVVTKEEIERAVATLSAQADLVVRRTASTVFLSTALMQNGRLDGLIVLFTQIQMIGRIARIYVQRPSPRELTRLYANVAGTAFVASGLESLDLGEMVAPLAVSVVPALKGGIPGLSGISALLVKCVSNGAANAFLTLRVGEVARRYCELTSRCPAELIRKSATAAAVQHLGRIVRENGALVVKKIWASTGRALIDSGVSKAEDIAGATRDLFGRISPWRLKEEDPAVRP